MCVSIMYGNKGLFGFSVFYFFYNYLGKQALGKDYQRFN